MTNEQVELLIELFENGYSIKCNQGYVDGFIQSIYLDENEHWVYASNTFTDVPLRQLQMHQFAVYQEVENWTEISFDESGDYEDEVDEGSVMFFV
jgi:hypothetical protein